MPDGPTDAPAAPQRRDARLAAILFEQLRCGLVGGGNGSFMLSKRFVIVLALEKRSVCNESNRFCY